MHERQEEHNLFGEFIRKWVFHILVIILGVAVIFTERRHDIYLAGAILLVTLAWIVRSIVEPPDNPQK